MKSENCPEIRCEIAEKSRRANKKDEVVERKAPSMPKLFTDSGRPYCLNKPKLDFTFNDEPDRYELDLHVNKWDLI